MVEAALARIPNESSSQVGKEPWCLPGGNLQIALQIARGVGIAMQ
jgi:hypothetical protein